MDEFNNYGIRKQRALDDGIGRVDDLGMRRVDDIGIVNDIGMGRVNDIGIVNDIGMIGRVNDIGIVNDIGMGRVDDDIVRSIQSPAIDIGIGRVDDIVRSIQSPTISLPSIKSPAIDIKHIVELLESIDGTLKEMLTELRSK